jgi:S1-C subfamily serine protease
VSEFDLAIVAFAALLAVLGFFQGFIVSAFSLLGLLVGGFAATRVAQQVLDDGAASPYAPMVGLLGALLVSALGGAALQDVGVWVRGRVRMREGHTLDRALGGMLSGAVGLLLAWLIAAVLMAMPQLRPMRPFVLQSSVVSQLNEVMPPSGPVLNVLARYDPFPTFDGPRIAVGAPDGDVPSDPEIRAAAAGVVRVVGSACGFRLTGSGWVVAPGLVVTNAHVVAGVREPAVQERGGDGPLDAEVVAFDTVADIALLQVGGLTADPLQMAAGDPQQGMSGAVLGFPENGPFTSRAARFSDTRAVRSDDIYGEGGYDRRVTSFRGDVRHGNSGGPLVDGEGRVLTTVFAAAIGGDVRGGYGVPNDVVAALVNEAPGSASTGNCTA